MTFIWLFCVTSCLSLMAAYKIDKFCYRSVALISICFGLNALCLFYINDLDPQRSFSLVNFGIVHLSFAFDAGLKVFSLLLLATPLVLFYLVQYFKQLNYHDANKAAIYIILAAIVSLIIAASANLFTMFVFYEILTLCTIPLITINNSAYQFRGVKYYLAILCASSMLLFLPAILIIGDVDFYNHADIMSRFNESSAILLFILCLFGVAKAAIFPVHSWMIHAMVAPHPISAIIHGVIVVNAGIVALFKIVYYVYGFDNVSNLVSHYNIILIIPFISIIYSAIKASISKSLKSILAFSTINQLSFIILILITNPQSTTFFAMLSHGSSKVILFLAAGLLYAKMGITEINQLAGARRSWPQIAILLSLTSFSLMGIPFLSGGVVKGLIAEGIDDELSIFLPIIQIFTTSYSVRIIYYCFKSSKIIASEHCASKKCDSIWGLFVFYFLAEGFLLSYMIRKNSIIFDAYLYVKFIAILALGAFSAYCLNYVAKLFEGKSLPRFNYSGEYFWSLKHEIVNINIDSRIELMFIIGGLVLLLI